MIIYRKSGGKPSVYYKEAVKERLCSGWIALSVISKAATSSSPGETPKSNWSALNKRRVKQLTEEGLIMPQGLALIAEANGAWTALDEVEALKLPKELAAALKKNKTAAGYFDAFLRSVKRGILEWINNSKRETTKERGFWKRFNRQRQRAGRPSK